MPNFIHGLKLNAGFFKDVVGPLMARHFPGLRYSAGLVGHGSDVLGFDSRTSVDHDWGPHLHIFLSSVDFVGTHTQINEMLQHQLPYSYRGYPTNFIEGDRYRKHIPKLITEGPVNHLFRFWTLPSFFDHYLGFDVRRKPSLKDWLLFPQQALIEVTAGELYHDDLGIQKVRNEFAYFPDDIWKYLMRVQWGKLVDELQTQARTGEEDDALGSQVVAGRTVHKIMFLCFLMERRYAPYSKWFGSAFRAWLPSGGKLYPLLQKVLKEQDWQRRQKLLMRIYQMVGRMHNQLGITPPLSTKPMDFYGRGYPVIDAWQYVEEIEKTIRNPKLRKMKYPLGSVDQFIDHARTNQLEYFYLDLKDVIK